MLSTQLVAGETSIGFMTAAYESAKDTQLAKKDTYNAVALKALMYATSFMTVSNLTYSSIARKDRFDWQSPFQNLPYKF